MEKQQYHLRSVPSTIAEKLIEDPRIRNGGALFIDQNGIVYSRRPDGTDPRSRAFDLVPIPKKVWETTYKLGTANGDERTYGGFTRYFWKSREEASKYVESLAFPNRCKTREITEDQMEK